jgi:tetratricopeptide (TPR) repeat protein
MLSGQYDQAIRRLEAVDEINTKIGSAWGRAFCAELLGTIYWELGEYSQAMNHMARAVHLGEESGYLMAQVMGRATLGMVYGHLGRISEGIELCRQAVELGQSKAGAFAAQSLASLTWVYVLDGNLTEAEEAIHAAWQALDQRISFPIEPNYVAVVEGYLALAARDWPRLSTAADRAMGMITAMHNRFLAVDAVYLQGQALLAQGQVAEARSLFRQACADAEAIGCRRMLWPILITMNQIETDPAKAQLLLEQAREIVSSISSQIRKPEWQASFLNQGSVKTVFDPSIFN